MFERNLREFSANLLACLGGLRSAVAIFAALILLTSFAPGMYGQGRERSKDYEAVQKRLATGWNTWDVHSVTTQVLLPEGLAIRVGVQYNSTLNGDGYLGDVLIGGPAGTRNRCSPGRMRGTAATPTCELRGENWICGFKARTLAKTWCSC